MTLAIIALLFSFSTWFCIFKPTLESMRVKHARTYELHQKVFKLRVARTFIPELHNMSLDEIEDRYGLDNVYHQVGRIRFR